MNATNPSAKGSDEILKRLAAGATTPVDWLLAWTGELARSLPASVIAVSTAEFSGPRMLVLDDAIAANLDRASIKTMLADAPTRMKSVQLKSTIGDVPAWVVAVPLLPRAAILVVAFDHDEPTRQRLLDFLSRVAQHSQPETTGVDSIAPTAIRSTATRSGLRSFHEDLDPVSTAMRIAAESPMIAGCDRVIVLTPQKRFFRRDRYRVRAVSGVAIVDQKSELVRAAERLATAASVLRCNLQFPSLGENSGPDDDLPPQLMEPVENYLDQSGGLSVVAVPIFEIDGERDASGLIDDTDAKPQRSRSNRPSMPIAMMLLETFSGSVVDRDSPILNELAAEASIAIGNADRHDRLRILPLRQPLAGVSRAAFRHGLLAAMLVGIGAAAASWLVVVDHTVIATGAARPQTRRAVFAAIDGIVQSVHVADGDRVTAGERLVTLKNSEIERETESIAGQLATSAERLASLRAMRATSGESTTEAAQNLIEQGTLRREIEALIVRQEINDRRAADLSVRAPIDGVVVAWRLSQRLTERPLSRGDRLLAVIEPRGPWELDLRLPERVSGEVVARHRNGETLPIRFAIASQPTRTFAATLDSIGGVARQSADGTSVIDLIARVNPDDAPEMAFTGFRGDDEVTAKIVCGRRRWIDSATTGLFDWLHRVVIFRLWE